MKTKKLKQIHIPVLLKEVLEGLAIKPDDKIIDGTVGAGGHSSAMLDLGAYVLGVDQDETILRITRSSLKHPRLKLYHANFRDLALIAKEAGFTEVDGILLDLGMSSLQIDDKDRGFSFKGEAPLDMRMDQSKKLTAADLVNTLSEDELFALIMKHSQERKARKIAHAIVTQRKESAIETTTQLAEIVTKVYGQRFGKIHPATKTFQALRIAVNQEISVLKAVLPQAVSLLKSGGRLCIISFHEGEDRAVKTFFKAKNGTELTIISKKAIRPSKDELERNPRARSARLRVAEKK